MSETDDGPEHTRTDRLNTYGELKRAVHERDRQQCTNCLASREVVDTLDVDHDVPRGVGGSDQFSNLLSLCRRCHEAKHGDGIAPTVHFESTGRMTDTEFLWFRQFLKEILPALARVHGVRLKPKFNLDDRQAWYLPMGDLRRLDSALTEADSRYCSLQVSEYL